MTTSPLPSAREVTLVLDAVNAMFARDRHAQTDAEAMTPALAASHASVAYIEAFWPHVARLIADDPRQLGLSLATPDGSRRTLVDARRVPEVVAAAAGDLMMLQILAPMRMMSEVLNSATAAWAQQLRTGGCPLRYSVEADDYVSLRTLLPDQPAPGSAVGANAPTLVMGGTTTAVTLCWNLLLRLPGAYREATGKVPTRGQLERLWSMTRELIFRIGGGSLAAFVGLASACAERQSDLIWAGMHDLGLSEVESRWAWTMNEALFGRVLAMIKQIHLAQQGHYVGCAALYARAPALPLASDAVCDAANDVDGGRLPTIFGELVRWITAVAQVEYFPLFASAH